MRTQIQKKIPIVAAKVFAKLETDNQGEVFKIL